MSARFILKNASIYFNYNKATTISFGGVTYNVKTWYDNVTCDATIYGDSSAVYPAFGLTSGEKVENGLGAYGTSIDNYPVGYADHYNTSGKSDSYVFTRGTFDSRLYMLANTTTGTYYFHGDCEDVETYTTTLDCSGISIGGSAVSSSNCTIWFGSLGGDKATFSGTSASFTTPSGGGDCKIWFSQLNDSSSYYEFPNGLTDGDGVSYSQNSDGSFTISLNGESDTNLTLKGSVIVSDKVELMLSNLMIDGSYVTSSSDLVIGYHFDSGVETKYKYTGANISISYERGAYSTFYVSFYNNNGSVYGCSELEITSSILTDWSTSDNVCWCSLGSSSDSNGTFYGELTSPSETYTLNIASMTCTDGEDFISKYSGAVLTYQPENGYAYPKGTSFDVTCAISGGWKFDITSGAYSNVHPYGGDGVTKPITFVDEYTITFNIPSDIANPIAYVYDMLAIKKETPVSDYATFITPYLVTQNDVNAIANAVWINEDGSEINATNNILSYKQIYDTLTSDKSQTLKLGGYSTGRSVNYLVDYQYTRNLGSVKIEEYWHNADDYDNTEVTIYVPLVGLVSVDTGRVMGHNVYLEYRYEIINGKGLAVIYSDCYSPNSIIYQASCNFSVTEPITNNDMTEYANSYWTILSNQMGDLKPFVMIDRKQPASDVISVRGNDVQVVKKVSDCSGYVAFNKIFLQDIGATNTEFEEITKLLTSGVIV